MADEFRSIRENLFKVLTNLGTSASTAGDDDGQPEDTAESRQSVLDAGAAKALFGAFFARAGKGKDEVVQTVAREIGMAVAAMLKEPLSQLAKHQKLTISFEFVPKEGHAAAIAREEEEEVAAARAAQSDSAPPKSGKRKVARRQAARAGADLKRNKGSSRRRKAGIPPG